MDFALIVTKVFCGGCSRNVKSKQQQVSCTTCQARFQKLCSNITNIQNQEISKQNIRICVYDVNQIRFHSLINQTRMSLINSGFNNFRFSSGTNIFLDEDFE